MRSILLAAASMVALVSLSVSATSAPAMHHSIKALSVFRYDNKKLASSGKDHDLIMMRLNTIEGECVATVEDQFHLPPTLPQEKSVFKGPSQIAFDDCLYGMVKRANKAGIFGKDFYVRTDVPPGGE